MKRALLLCSVAVMMCSLALGQDSPNDSGQSQNSTPGASATSAQEQTIHGKIGEDGKSFTTDEDNKTWSIMNPEAIKGHEGHHVELSAHVYPDKNSIHIMSVKMMGGDSGASTSGAAMGSEKSEASGASMGEGKKSAKLHRLRGTVGEDGKTFTTDNDKKSWTVMNPEVFKGHEGHHVKIKAHVYPDKDSIHVMSVKMMANKGEKSEGMSKDHS
jgi:hypothetical protein